MSSDTPLAGDGMFEQLTAIRETVRGEGDGGSDNEEVSGGAAPSGSFQVKKAPCPLSINRSSDPCNEFENNGMHIVEIFRGTYPLRRFNLPEGTRSPGLQRILAPKNFGFLSPRTGYFRWCKHGKFCFSSRTLQRTTSPRVFSLASQLRRHSMLRAVGGRVTQESFADNKFPESRFPTAKKPFPTARGSPLSCQSNWSSHGSRDGEKWR